MTSPPSSPSPLISSFEIRPKYAYLHPVKLGPHELHMINIEKEEEPYCILEEVARKIYGKADATELIVGLQKNRSVPYKYICAIKNPQLNREINYLKLRDMVPKKPYQILLIPLAYIGPLMVFFPVDHSSDIDRDITEALIQFAPEDGTWKMIKPVSGPLALTNDEPGPAKKQRKVTQAVKQ